jgi:HAD superfamily hydrolase (TIGR01509 family)
MTFEAVIFDLDGTLIDTESRTQAAGIEAFAECGIAVDPLFLQGLIGKDDRTGAGLVQAQFPELDFAAFTIAWGAAVHRHHSRGLPLKAGVMDLLAAIQQPVAIATSSTRAQADLKLELTGLGPHFLHVVTVDDVARAKPAPDPFLLAARLLGVDPARCLAFEDSEPGAEAAFAAGMTVVQVPDIVPASGRFAHLVAPDLLAGARTIGLLTE